MDGCDGVGLLGGGALECSGGVLVVLTLFNGRLVVAALHSSFLSCSWTTGTLDVVTIFGDLEGHCMRIEPRQLLLSSLQRM